MTLGVSDLGSERSRLAELKHCLVRLKAPIT